ncbi:hypothetical protein Hanom_Chr01g00074281 [Helianthus anomalus]
MQIQQTTTDLIKLQNIRFKPNMFPFITMNINRNSRNSHTTTSRQNNIPFP